MLDHSSLVGIFNIWEGMRTALISNQQTVTLREIARIIRSRQHLYKSTITVLTLSSRNTLADDAAARIATDVNHLCTSVRLLEIISNSHRIELRR